jgi:hypothetical protein
VDLASGELVCLKVVKNNKDYLDQSLDEIKLLQYLNFYACGGNGNDGYSLGGARVWCSDASRDYLDVVLYGSSGGFLMNGGCVLGNSGWSVNT